MDVSGSPVDARFNVSDRVLSNGVVPNSMLSSIRFSSTIPRYTFAALVRRLALPYRSLHLRCSKLCFAILITLSLSACAMQTTSPFDSSAWKSQRGVGAQQNQRGPMVASVEKAIHAGMSRDDVILLLGEPDTSDAATSTDVYELGVARYGIDEEFYEIRYQGGKVESHRWGRR